MSMTDIEFLNEMFPYYEDMTDLEVIQTASRRVGAEKMAKWKDEQLWLLIDAIDHAYLQTNGTYGELSYEVSDKVNYLKRVMKGE